MNSICRDCLIQINRNISRCPKPMFKALKLCPEAIVVAPRMDAYAEASKEIHKMMNELSPSIEPLSLDEAFIDLKGTEKLHGEPPALSMARLVQRIESEIFCYR